MKKFKINQKVRIGGKLGAIMTITKINFDGTMILKEPGCTFYYSPGDCSLVPVQEKIEKPIIRYEQLTLF